MFAQVLLLLTGLAMVVFGADWLVDGASGVARKAGISEFVIGLTIVGFGTSCPELVVSLTGAIEGSSDISIGNVLGSNILNTLLILGLTAVMVPVAMTRENRRRDIPFMVVLTILLVCLGMSSTLLGLGSADVLSRAEGILFLVLFTAYIWLSFKNGSASESGEETAAKPIWASVALVVAGLACLVAGGRFFVNSAVEIAGALGVSEKFIAVTILALGTSLPELATCVVAAAKHRDQLALGNIIGSNVFNILLILGTSAVVMPLSFSSLDIVDVVALVFSALLLWAWAYTGRKDRIDRWEGGVMLAAFAAYMAWMFIKL